MPITLQLIAVFALILLNGFFAMAEMALVTSRPARLRERARRGSRGAEIALDLIARPGRLLSAVQICITLVGVLASALSGASIAQRLGDSLNRIPWIAPNGVEAALAIVVLTITFLAVVLGEIAPKRLALAEPERIAIAVAPTLRLLCFALRPSIALVAGTAAVTLRAIGASAPTTKRASEEDVRHILAEATAAKAIDPAEQRIILRAMRMADRSIQTAMTPRTEVSWIDLNSPPERIRQALSAANHSEMVVAQGDIDNAIGVIRIRDVAAASVSAEPLDPAALVREPEFLPDTATILDGLSALQKRSTQMLLIIDEHGGLQGVVTPTDVLEAIAGSLADDAAEGSAGVRRHGAGFLIGGRTPVDELRTELELDPDVNEDIQSVAGLVMSELGRLPVEGEAVDIDGWRFEVLRMEERRIETLFASRSMDHPRN